MSFLTRPAAYRPLATLLRPSSRAFATTTIRPAGTDYGSKQSGHEQGINEKNPMSHLEHPGPESPASTGQAQSGSDKSGASQPQSGSSGQKSSDQGSSGGKPTIQKPESGAEDQNPEVRKHNEEVKNRNASQSGEKDEKVDKGFWKGKSQALHFC